MSRASDIHAEMVANGFSPDRRVLDGLGYLGSLIVRGRPVTVGVRFADASLSALPKLHLPKRAEEMPGLAAHIERDDTVCYVREQDLVLDPFDARGTVALCLIKMREALERIASLDLTTEIAAEFPQHWQGIEFLVDLPEGFAGAARIWQLDRPEKSILVCSNDKAVLRRLGLSPGEAAALDAKGQEVAVVGVSTPLTFPRGHIQPTNLQELLHWAESIDPRLGAKVFDALASAWPLPARCMIHAPNGTIGVVLALPADIAKVMKRPAFLRRILSSRPAAIGVRRLSGQRVDAQFIFERNMDKQPNLSGKNIALVGCGTIGGYLAKLLVQSGAGFDGGQIVLIDEQTLSAGNIGRHYLGARYIGRPKAITLRDTLRADYPDNRIEAWLCDARTRIADLAGFDLVLDATGDQAFSDVLSVDFDAQRLAGCLSARLLHVWLVGNGVAAQALFYDGSGACIRCLRLDSNSDVRFETLRPDHPARITAADCGEGSYFAYGPGAPAIAAGLALQLSLDWCAGHPAPNFRTIRIVQDATRAVKDGSPARRERCPACGRNAA